MTLKSMGLWLAPHEVDPSRVKQVNAVAREAAALCPDAILFPEGWLIIHPQDADLVDEIVAEVTQPLRENGTRCFVGVEVRGRQLLMDAAEPSVPYMKHSSAGHVAFQEEQWSAHRNLPDGGQR